MTNSEMEKATSGHDFHDEKEQHKKQPFTADTINFVVKAASKKVDRFHLNGVYFENDDGFLRLVGADDHRLHSVLTDVPLNSDFENFLILAKDNDEPLDKIKQKGKLKFEVLEDNEIRIGNRVYKADYETRFPEWRKVIFQEEPQGNAFSLGLMPLVNPAQLLDFSTVLSKLDKALDIYELDHYWFTADKAQFSLGDNMEVLAVLAPVRYGSKKQNP